LDRRYKKFRNWGKIIRNYYIWMSIFIW